MLPPGTPWNSCQFSSASPLCGIQIVQGWWLHACSVQRLSCITVAWLMVRKDPARSQHHMEGSLESLVPLNSCQCLLPGSWQPQGSACPLTCLLGAPSDCLSPERC